MLPLILSLGQTQFSNVAGFRSPLFVLGSSASPVTTQGGFRTPLPTWNAGANAGIVQGGFRTPLPTWNAGASPAVVQGGYRGMMAYWAGGAGGLEPVVPTTPKRSPGTYDPLHVQGTEWEEEDVLLIATAFLEIIQ